MEQCEKWTFFNWLLSLGEGIGVELAGHMVINFNHLGTCQTVFQSIYTILHSHPQCMKVLISLYPHLHLRSSDFLIAAVLVGGEVISLWFWFAVPLPLTNLRPWRLTPVFPSKNLMFLALAFRFLAIFLNWQAYFIEHIFCSSCCAYKHIQMILFIA